MPISMKHTHQYPDSTELYQGMVNILLKLGKPPLVAPDLAQRLHDLAERIAADRPEASDADYPFQAPDPVCPKLVDDRLEFRVLSTGCIAKSLPVTRPELAATNVWPVNKEALTSLLLEGKTLLDDHVSGKEGAYRGVVVNEGIGARSSGPTPPVDVEVLHEGCIQCIIDDHAGNALGSKFDPVEIVPPRQTKSKRILPHGKCFAKAQKAQSLREAFRFAATLGKPLNSFWTISLRDHDHYDTRNLGKARQSLRKTLRYAWTVAGAGVPSAVSCVENDRKGGLGLHTHILAHIPGDESNYVECVRQVTRIMAPDFSKVIDRLFRQTLARRDWRSKIINKNATAMARQFLGNIPPGATSAQKYNALRSLRAALGDTHYPIHVRRKAVETIPLPFLIEEDCIDQPLNDDDAGQKLRYICKQVDPQSPVNYRQQLTTLENLPVGAVNLQMQSKRRPKRCLLSCSQNINATAQAKWAKANNVQMPPVEPLEDWFIRDA